jgi:hypothetical protein
MRLAVRVGALGVALSLALLAPSAPAGAAPKPITGKLSTSGYTVIALEANGKASVVLARRGMFTLLPPARRVTLHLRSPTGKYAGPIVIGRKKKGRRAILGVRAGARLGRVRVHRGYAKVARRLSRKWIDAKRIARARKGVPIGAQGFGRVRSKPPRASIPGDLDADGIPEPLDIDDDGDLILDNLDSSTAGRRARAAQVIGCGPENIYCQDVSSGLGLSIEESVNANAALDPTQLADLIDEALGSHGVLGFEVRGAGTRELDCGKPQKRTDPTLGGLVYCTRGGTGTASAGATGAPPFPGPLCPAADPLCFDPDGDGFGALDPSREPLACGGGCPNTFFLLHGAGSDQIGSGDELIEHVATGVPEDKCPSPRPACVSFTTTLQFVFVTVPALVSYSDGAGNPATVSYPVARCPPSGCPAGGPETLVYPFPVAAGPSGDVVLRLTFWRPQRRPIPPETGEWIDIGGLTYSVAKIVNPELPGDRQIPESVGPCAISTTDPNLTPNPLFPGGGGLEDSTKDQPASRANTLAYTLNVTQCLATKGLSWGQGHLLEFQFQAAKGANTTRQTVTFRRQ